MPGTVTEILRRRDLTCRRTKASRVWCGVEPAGNRSATPMPTWPTLPTLPGRVPGSPLAPGPSPLARRLGQYGSTSTTIIGRARLRVHRVELPDRHARRRRLAQPGGEGGTRRPPVRCSSPPNSRRDRPRTRFPRPDDPPPGATTTMTSHRTSKGTARERRRPITRRRCGFVNCGPAPVTGGLAPPATRPGHKAGFGCRVRPRRPAGAGPASRRGCRAGSTGRAGPGRTARRRS